MSTEAETCGDFRSHAAGQRRNKEFRVKYRSVNASLLGQPVNIYSPWWKLRGSTTWNNNNKFRMKDTPSRWDYPSPIKTNRRKFTCADNADVICAAPTPIIRKAPRLNLGHSDVDDFRDMDSGSSEDEGEQYMDGVAYSFDNEGPTHGNVLSLSDAVTQAVEKFQSKELSTLIKKEYEFVNECDTDEDFELV